MIKKGKGRIIFILWAVANSSLAEAAVGTLDAILKSEISKSYTSAEVSFEGPVRWVRGTEPTEIAAISLLGDDGRGNMHFLAKAAESGQESEAWVPFSARVIARVAVLRVHPSDVLREDMFTTQSLEVSRGLAHESRGILLPPNVSLANLEAIQSVLEGQFLTSVAVRKIPDVRRGDLVQVHLRSSGLVLSTTGIAEEPGYVKGRIRVMAGKSKRELSGFLLPGGIVEVSL